ncbi:MAG: hypothetical protein WCG29_02875 [Desulfomonile sp.]
MRYGHEFKACVCGLLCLLIFLHVSDAVGQTIGSPEIPILGASFDQRWLAAGSAGQKDCWSAASLYACWMTVPNRIHPGYDGLVLPGACISSFFVDPLSGVQVGGSLPIRLADQYALRVYGSYLIAHNPQASQDLTWTNNPPGIREWRHSNSESYKFGGEMLYQMSGDMTLVGGFRLESLLTNFSDPNPDYVDTAAWLQAQTTVTVYEPYVGIRLQQCPRRGGLSLQAVAFPFLFATIQHLNVCDNNGVPYAHTGSQYAHEGFFVEASAEYRLWLFQGLEAAGFVDWNVYQGHCPMTIERHQGGVNRSATTGAVAWSHLISSLVVGGKVEMSWSLPF